MGSSKNWENVAGQLEKFLPLRTFPIGIENAVGAWIGPFQVKNIGKMLMKLGGPKKIS